MGFIITSSSFFFKSENIETEKGENIAQDSRTN